MSVVEVVTLHKGTPMTLKSVFQSMNLSTYDLTVDMLDVHAVSHARSAKDGRLGGLSYLILMFKK